MSGLGKLGSHACGFLIVAAVAAAASVLMVSAFLAQPQEIRYESVTERTSVGSDALYSYELTRYQSSARVVEERVVERSVSIGISSATDSLDFGEIPAGGNYARREISLVNLEAAPATVSLAAEGAISPRVGFERNGFVLAGGESATVGVFFSAQGAEPGEYSGEVTVQVRRPRYAAFPVLG